jgi:disulfide bond formation protein DsbB
MLTFLNSLPESRKSWLSLAAIATAFELTALYFQHVIGLAPCVMCIYQRTAILGVVFAGLIGAIAPKQLVVRIVAYALWGVSAFKGLFIALEHVNIQVNQSPFFSCDFRPNFTHTIAVDEWLPFFFKADGDCASISWTFLSWSMSQWMVIIFAGFSFSLVVILLNRLRPSNQFKI